VAILLYSASALTLGALFFTVKAAPIMLSIQNTNDPRGLQQAFAAFYFWGNLRAGCHVSAFGVELWALSTMSDRGVFWRKPAVNRPETFP
jgi:hypothetical protein